MRAGMQVGQVILDRKLGQGGMAEVWLGHNAVLGTPVAVKFLIAPWAGNAELEHRFLNEAKRQGALDHPNIVKVYGFEYVEDHSFLIMQYIDGQSLEDKIEQGGRRPLEFAEILRIANGALAGLDYAHEHNVVHRDIKPSNIMIDRSGHIYISDFGLAVVRDEQRMTRTGSSMGTPLYMSPEQILRPKDVDHRADIYSFGCMLYELFGGRTPFGTNEEDTDFNIKMAHASAAAAPLGELNPAVPPGVEAVVMRCLEKNPDHRFATCSELREALVKAMPDSAAPAPPSRDDFQKLFNEPQSPAPLPIYSPLPHTVPPPPAPAPRRRRMLIAVLIALCAPVAVAVGGATYYVTRYFFAMEPRPQQQTTLQPALQTGPQHDAGGSMPQPESKAGQLPNTVPAAGSPNAPQGHNPIQPQPHQEPFPQPQTQQQQRQPVMSQLETQPLNKISFRAKLRTNISSESSEEGQTIMASVIAPASCRGCTLIGLVQKVGRTGFIGMRRSELLFNFHTLRFPDGQMRAVACRVTGFKNSKGEAGTDEEDQKVDAAHAAKKIFITAAAGTVIGAITRRNKEGAAQGAATGAQVGVMLTGFTAKGKSMSFAPGSTFELKVSDSMEQAQ